MKDFEKKITEEIKCIDNFVKEVDKNEITNLWYSICSRSYIRLNIPLITTSREIYEEMYQNYNMFIYSLSLKNKLEYIYFYEKYFNKEWKLLIDIHDYNISNTFISDMLERLGNNRWWEEAFSDFGIKN